MKKYLKDFFVGLISGLIAFAGAEFLMGESILFVSPYYYLISLIFFGIYFFLFKKKPRQWLTPLILFFVGFAFPILVWLFLVNQAISNFGF